MGKIERVLYVLHCNNEATIISRHEEVNKHRDAHGICATPLDDAIYALIEKTKVKNG